MKKNRKYTTPQEMAEFHNLRGDLGDRPSAFTDEQETLDRLLYHFGWDKTPLVFAKIVWIYGLKKRRR